MRKNFLSLIIIAVMYISAIMVTGNVAAYEFAPGVVKPGPGENGSALTSFYCGNAANNWAECPRWILVRHQDYIDIINDEGRIAGGSSQYAGLHEVCQTDEHVVIAGNLKMRKYANIGAVAQNLILYNMDFEHTRWKNNGEWHNGMTNFKVKKNPTSYVTSDGTVVTERNSTFFGWALDTVPDKTYANLLNDIIADSGYSEREIAVFCESMVYGNNYTVTAYAIDEDGNLLNSGNPIANASGVQGSSVTVGRGSFNPSGYTFTSQWKYYDDKTGTRAGQTFTVENIDGNKNVYAVYKKKPTTQTTECSRWTPTSYTNSGVNSSGNGKGTTSVVSYVKNGTLGGDYTGSVYAKPSDNINWIHCYFPGVQEVASAVATEIHASESNTLPDGTINSNSNTTMSSLYSWGNSFTVTSSVDKGSGFRDPNSSSTGNYRTGTLTPSIYNGGRYAIGNSSAKTLLDNTYNVENDKAGATLTESNESSSPSVASVSNNGIHTWSCNYECNSEKCGTHDCNCTTTQECTGEGAARTCKDVTTCEKCCNSCAWGSCKHSNNYYPSSCTSSSANSSADVLVPYNFTNTATISLSTSTVYAGETANISSAEVQVRTRTNNRLSGTYATRVDNAQSKIVAYLSSSSGGSAITGAGSDICGALGGRYQQCNVLKSNSNLTFNPNNNISLNSAPNTIAATNDLPGDGSSFNVYDAPAGSYYCVVAAVYPYTVKSDLDMDASGSNSWYVSAPSCAIIAKRPSLQVWGSGMYSNGEVRTSTAIKRVIDGFVGFTSNNSSNAVTFGSWVETGIISNGKINGLASGAATGFASAPGTVTAARTLTSGSNRLGGSKNSITGGAKGCILGPLTIPNSFCVSSGGIPGIGNSGTTGSANANMDKPVDVDAIISKFMSNDGTYVYSKDFTTITQFINGKLGGSGVIPAGQNHTYVIDASGKTFTIDRNIQYADVYHNFLDIPKLIIRADNINIQCGVTRVDAVLIADKKSGNQIAGVVDTCSNGGSVNAVARSNQLKINGTVITGSLKAGRTYGAGTGAYSVLPAEIIDYDSSLYLWGAPRGSASGSGRLDTVYMQELSPRL